MMLTDREEQLLNLVGGFTRRFAIACRAEKQKQMINVG